MEIASMRKELEVAVEMLPSNAKFRGDGFKVL
jgi:hypothetical protein